VIGERLREKDNNRRWTQIYADGLLEERSLVEVRSTEKTIA
jgi:hypothetical protein